MELTRTDEVHLAADDALSCWRRGVVAGMELLASQLASATEFRARLGLPHPEPAAVLDCCIRTAREHFETGPTGEPGT